MQRVLAKNESDGHIASSSLLYILCQSDGIRGKGMSTTLCPAEVCIEKGAQILLVAWKVPLSNYVQGL